MSDETTGYGYADGARRYRLDARIATGGMGEVWRGTDTTLGRVVAVKLLKIEYADNPSFRARFETEAQHAASLHHANIAAVYDFGEAATDDGSGVQRPFLVMEYVDGQPLSALLRPSAPMDPVAVRELLAQAADGLAAAHAAGIVHRDVKPANLLVTPDRQVKVTDFGIARAAEGTGLTKTGEVMGTPQYLSPEQARGEAATPASDVYSLGVVAFECLAGRRPYVGETAVATALAHLREPVPELPDDVPADLSAVVRQAMAKLPQDRFADGAALATALRDPATAATRVAAAPLAAHEHTEVLPGVVPTAPTLTPGPPTGQVPEAAGRVKRRNALWPVLAVLAFAVVAILAVVLFAPSDGDDEPPSNRPSQQPDRTPEQPTTTEASTPAEPTSTPPSTPSSQPPTEATTPTTPTTPSTPTTEPTTEPTTPSPTGTTSPTEPTSSPATPTQAAPTSSGVAESTNPSSTSPSN